MSGEHEADRCKALVRRLYERINDHDADAAAALYSARARNHGREVGREGMRAVFASLFATFPDFHYRIDETTAETNRVVCKVTMTGTHLGRPQLPLFGAMLNERLPTGKRVEVLQFHAFDIEGEEIAAHAAVRDDLGMLKQLGIVG